MPKPLQHKLRIIASTPNCLEFLELLELMATDIADVRTTLGENDSLEIRQALSSYLSKTVDEVKRIKNNTNRNFNQDENDDL